MENSEIFINVCGYVGFLLIAVLPIHQIQKFYLLKSTNEFSYGYLFYTLLGLILGVIYTESYRIMPPYISGIIQIILFTILLCQKIYYERRTEIIKNRQENRYNPHETFI